MLPILLLIAALAAAPASEGWSRFRGPNGSGVSDSRGLPLEFGPTTNVVWKTTLPPGFSSPVIGGDRIFLTAHRGEALLTLALDRRTGRILWEREAPRSRVEPLDKRNNPASPSPVTDGRDVYVFFGDYGVVAYTVEGRERWRVPLGPFNNVYGMGASPVLVDGAVVLVCDQGTNSFIIALDARDGRVRWKTARPEARSGHSTPIVYRPAAGAAQIVVPGSFLLTAYAADTGAKVWWVRGLAFELKSVPVVDGDTVYINGFGSNENEPGRHVDVPLAAEVFPARDADKDGRLSREELPDRRAQGWMPFIDLDRDQRISRDEWDYYKAALDSENGLLAIRLGGRGDVTATNVRWTYRRAVPQLPSPLVYKNILYMVNDGGIVTSLDPATGEVLKQGRLKGAIDAYFASPVAADDKIFMVSEKGKVAVLKPDGSLDVLALNDLGEDAYATPAIMDGRLYVRTRSTLYCFGSP
jgi:outer membrane protein assembly factor BamB